MTHSNTNPAVCSTLRMRTAISPSVSLAFLVFSCALIGCSNSALMVYGIRFSALLWATSNRYFSRSINSTIIFFGQVCFIKHFFIWLESQAYLRIEESRDQNIECPQNSQSLLQIQNLQHEFSENLFFKPVMTSKGPFLIYYPEYSQ